MTLTLLRRKRDELIEELKDGALDEFDPVDEKLLEGCTRGEKWSLDKFRSEYREWVPEDGADSDDDDGYYDWVSFSHKKFYEVCMEIGDLEQSEYKKAMGRV